MVAAFYDGFHKLLSVGGFTVPADSDSGGRPGLLDLLRDPPAPPETRPHGDPLHDVGRANGRRPYLPSVVWRDNRERIRPYIEIRASGRSCVPERIENAVQWHHDGAADVIPYTALWDGGMEPGATVRVYDASLLTVATLWRRLRGRLGIHCVGIEYPDDSGSIFTGCIRTVVSDAWLQAHGIATRQDDGLD